MNSHKPYFVKGFDFSSPKQQSPVNQNEETDILNKLNIDSAETLKKPQTT